MAPLDSDPRWQRLLQQTWTCGACGEPHRGIPDLGCGKPEPWEGPEDERMPNSAAVSSTHFLSDDFCILDGKHFFVRCVLDLPILGSGGHSLGLGVWSTLAEKNFRTYVETFDSATQGNLGPWFGWFSVHLKGYPDTRNLKCQVHPRDDRQRPWVELEPTDHPLSREQREGIILDRVFELHALNGHDSRRTWRTESDEIERRPARGGSRDEASVGGAENGESSPAVPTVRARSGPELTKELPSPFLETS